MHYRRNLQKAKIDFIKNTFLRNPHKDTKAFKRLIDENTHLQSDAEKARDEGFVFEAIVSSTIQKTGFPSAGCF